MYRKRAHAGLSGWIHTRTAQIAPNVPHTSDAAPGEPHNDWRYDASRGGWVYKDGTFQRGDVTGSHGGWDYDGRGKAANATTSDVVVVDTVGEVVSDGITESTGAGAFGMSPRTLMMLAGAAAVVLFLRRRR